MDICYSYSIYVLFPVGQAFQGLFLFNRSRYKHIQNGKKQNNNHRAQQQAIHTEHLQTTQYGKKDN